MEVNMVSIGMKTDGLEQQQKRKMSKKQSTRNTCVLILLMWVVGSAMLVQAHGTHHMDALAKNVFTDPLERCDFFFQGHDKIPPIFSYNETGTTNISAFAPRVLHKDGNVVKSGVMYDRNCVLLTGSSSNGRVRARHSSCKKAFSIRNGRLSSKFEVAGPHPRQWTESEVFQDAMASSLRVVLPLQRVQLLAMAGSGGSPGTALGRDVNRRALEERRCLTFYLRIQPYPEMATGLALELLELLPGLFKPDVEHKKKLHDLHTSASHVESELGALAGRLLGFP